MTTEALALAYPEFRRGQHPDCIVCSPDHEQGLKLEFQVTAGGVVEASFCPRAMEGYPGYLHGGVVSMVLDGAMANCLFSQGRTAMTVFLNIQFRHPVILGRPATVRAWTVSADGSLYEMAAELLQEGQRVATASARFLERGAVVWYPKGGT